jgi:hypothetical protein
MKIAIVAWGSLIWEPRSIQTTTAFVAFGPVLPIEFCRVSGGKRLTLVIDEVNGVPCQTYVAKSGLPDLDEALLDLWVREGSGIEKPPTRIRESGRVAFVDLTSGTASAKALNLHSRAIETVRSWAKATGHDAVIWTALATNFHEPEKAGKPFTVEAALEYLDGLDKPDLASALHYIWNAPTEVQTPVRAAVTARWPQG